MERLGVVLLCSAQVVNHWIECSWEGAGPSKRGIVQAGEEAQQSLSNIRKLRFCKGQLRSGERHCFARAGRGAVSIRTEG